MKRTPRWGMILFWLGYIVLGSWALVALLD